MENSLEVGGVGSGIQLATHLPAHGQPTAPEGARRHLPKGASAVDVETGDNLVCRVRGVRSKE